MREDFGPDSDVDVLIRFHPQARHTLFDIGRMQEELTRIFGCVVDLIEHTAVEQSRNYIRRQAIFQSAEVVHAT
jgi:predicted nucleotidyltransferase